MKEAEEYFSFSRSQLEKILQKAVGFSVLFGFIFGVIMTLIILKIKTS